jgi:hypothetical protein
MTKCQYLRNLTCLVTVDLIRNTKSVVIGTNSKISMWKRILRDRNIKRNTSNNNEYNL